MMTTTSAASHVETPDVDGAYARLSPERLDALAKLDERRETQAGEPVGATA